ncbi:MAG: hypothetical protein B7X90_06985 [Novosphingobium sp. 17-62-19]|uniref:hypothetical protein n=1 Tax=Novosphingobium sp. 17-62-19 TaxID=1970406 RepID=UPI000BCDB1A2|nr:hypothetical protein [Novosphingobium sp. 17-62-19]OYX95459.1 MAG: hypothetical protein B7Y74_04260 [Novosphingobium sp. 35-62-5]OZA20086.1 MAG: hypothetical protein B7X90_06985 [Novosphingobium sp. 17-62-19]HQS97430.1 hypothetical protein [Novosphingobium sp.]
MRRRLPLSGARNPLILGGAIGLALLVAPTVTSAFSSGFDKAPVSLAARGGIGSFTPASVDERLAAQITVRALKSGKLFRFTPAGSDGRPNRSVTVAVRVDSLSAQGFAVRKTLADASSAAGTSQVRIAPMAFNLGLARGYASFATPAASASPLADMQRIDMPDLAQFKVASPASKPSRFAPRIEAEGRDQAGRAPRTLEGQGDYQVDLGGSYRLTRNLNVTAGVRYSPERDRLLPLTDGKQDNQAVYVGTQFRF